MVKRFDISNTSDWRPEALVCLYTGENEDLLDYIDMLMDDINESIRGRRDIDCWGSREARKQADPAGRFSQRGSCDHCGAWFLYGAAFRNAVSGETMVVGNRCAANLGLETDEYADKQMRDAVRRTKVRAAADAAMAKLLPNRQAALDNDHDISKDLRAKFRKYHDLSIRQWALAKKLVNEAKQRQVEEEQDPPPTKPALIEDRMGTVTGT